MNEDLFKNIISQFDFELKTLLDNATSFATTQPLADYFSTQDKLELLVKQRRDSVEYAKKQLKDM